MATTLASPIKQGALNTSLAISPTGMKFNVEVGKPYRVLAKPTSSDPAGWVFENKEFCDANGFAGKVGRFDNTQEGTPQGPYACQSAPGGMLIGVFVPKSFETVLNSTDLVTTETDPTKAPQAFYSWLKHSFPVGSEWQGIAPFDGFLVLFMNHRITLYKNASGSLSITVR